MSRRREQVVRNRTPAKNNARVAASGARNRGGVGKRARLARDLKGRSYIPPETWHEPKVESPSKYRILVQTPGEGYRHVLTPQDVKERLSQLPSWMTQSLEVVQLSQMTRKKRSFPCYGMQWGNAIYLYPIEDDRVEHFIRPPKPSQKIEAKMHGARWEEGKDGIWKLVWSEEAIRDFYLNNILIHELGHLVDQRNSSYTDRERFAEWFAIEYGFKASRRENLAEAAAAKLLGGGN